MLIPITLSLSLRPSRILPPGFSGQFCDLADIGKVILRWGDISNRHRHQGGFLGLVMFGFGARLVAGRLVAADRGLVFGLRGVLRVAGLAGIGFAGASADVGGEVVKL